MHLWDFNFLVSDFLLFVTKMPPLVSMKPINNNVAIFILESEAIADRFPGGRTSRLCGPPSSN